MTAPAGASGSSQDNNLVALSLMSGAMMIVPIMDVIAKYLALSLPPLEVTFGRFVFQLIISLAAAILTWNLKGLRSKRPAVNYLRGILLSAAVLCFFTAVKYMPVATAISIFFVEPMILTILAALILKEKVGLRRITAIFIGLAGALIILRPSFVEIGPASLLPLLTATFFASYLLLNRLYAGADGLLAIQFSAGLAGSVVLGIALAVGTLLGNPDYAFAVPDLNQTGFLFAIGAISFVGHGLVVSAFQKGEAALLAPLQYLEIVSATLFGFLVFGDFPDGPTWIGIALIVGSGLYITQRERALNKRRANEPGAKL
ncbi:DMT family transporter [uncultured Roseibium sp.]|uniref:DMT family transporter n=1 Tax=uncultured Roseibium sp. TaxID=1936171 RepID=UPI0032179DA4